MNELHEDKPEEVQTVKETRFAQVEQDIGSEEEYWICILDSKLINASTSALNGCVYGQDEGWIGSWSESEWYDGGFHCLTKATNEKEEVYGNELEQQNARFLRGQEWLLLERMTMCCL